LFIPQYDALSADGLAMMRIDTEAHRSACLLRMALIRWRLEKGQLPPRLDYLSGPAVQFILDPWSGQMWGYLPEGSIMPLKFSNLETSQALLWSAGVSGARVIPDGVTDAGQIRYTIVAGWAGVRPQPGVRGIGLAFPIP
jgi:hypothetical protein